VVLVSPVLDPLTLKFQIEVFCEGINLPGDGAGHGIAGRFEIRRIECFPDITPQLTGAVHCESPIFPGFQCLRKDEDESNGQERQEPFGECKKSRSAYAYLFDKTIQADGFKTLHQGQYVSFDVAQGAKGPAAANVKLL
jgi:CspA family cold shock protein